jgi:hypothetical protein
LHGLAELGRPGEGVHLFRGERFLLRIEPLDRGQAFFHHPQFLGQHHAHRNQLIDALGAEELLLPAPDAVAQSAVAASCHGYFHAPRQYQWIPFENRPVF